ncbi:hypothetical protein TrRE_jg2660 [Triparma retinervis]|uniref:Mitochondrial splicing suppressor 51-like C-terminal domain-containing protein n=1 Tax=Triparma retinervis TaxID=2557542 RepID=A0A9W6ZTL6_9STRA|nr:hypothetical protein TrRE_jg2660 [Triparma retinervis]
MDPSGKPPCSIDVAAVTACVRSIKLRNPSLARALDAGASKLPLPSPSPPPLAPIDHKVIPPLQTLAWVSPSPKAIAASAALSRSATIAEALDLLSILDASPPSIIVDVVGVDAVDAGSPSIIKRMFHPLLRWVHRATGTRTLLRLSGPNVPSAMHCHESKAEGGEISVSPLPYHEFLDANAGDPADLAVAFNAGIWGYTDWDGTLARLSEPKGSNPRFFLVTSYTKEEAEEDEEKIARFWGGDGRRVWEGEANRWRSRKERETKAREEAYYENSHWGCWGCKD